MTPVHPALQPCQPLAPGAIENAVGRLDDMARQLLALSGVPGLAVAVVQGNKTIYANGFGVRDVRTLQPVDPDTVFQLASLSKPIGASVVANQVGQRVINWETPVVSQLPWFALSDPLATQLITIGDLYAHRSGLPDHAGDLLEDLGYDRRQVLERLRFYRLDAFRAAYWYTNFGLTAAAEAVAQASGRTWADLADESLFGPLGMTASSFRFADYEASPNRAVGHIHVEGRYEPRYTRDADAQAPAGGASSTVTDLARWLIMILGNGRWDGETIIAPAALLPAVTPQSVSHRGTEPAMRSDFYGYGFNVSTTPSGRVQLSHSGAFALGVGTNMLILPEAEVAIVALTNGSPAGVAEALTAQFAELIQFGEIRNDWYGVYHAYFVGEEKPSGSLVGQPPPTDPRPPRR